MTFLKPIYSLIQFNNGDICTQLLYGEYPPCTLSNSMATRREDLLHNHTVANRNYCQIEFRRFLSGPWKTPTLCNKQFVS